MDDPLVENPKFFPEFFFIWGWVEKRPPPLGELKAFWGRYFGGPENFRHFGQQTVATQKAQSWGGVGVRGYGGRGI